MGGDEPVTRLFGTDGIRGVANEEPLTPDLAFRVGRQLVATLAIEHGTDRVRLVIGRDTRLSGPLLEAALVAGLLSAGAECYAAGVLPTPAIALLTKKLGAHGGIVLSASHNLFEDNGIKLFSSEGTKFPDAWENAIEQRLQGDDSAPRARGARIGRLIAHTRAEAEYVEFLCGCFPLDLSGLTVALDCAHGATYRVAPRVFRRLGARVLTIGTRPDGTNINAESGALHPERLQRMVRANLGGEQSGHLLFLDHSPAGDGILSALALLSVAAETGETLASLAGCLSKFPQVLRNVAVRVKPPIESLTGLAERVAAFEREMNGAGRILIRYSGTEPLARSEERRVGKECRSRWSPYH